jgi:hypothetical protein
MRVPAKPRSTKQSSAASKISAGRASLRRVQRLTASQMGQSDWLTKLNESSFI